MYSNKETNETGQGLLGNKWLTGDHVCHILEISKRTLQNYRDRGILPFAQIGRKIYYKATDLDEFLESHHVRASFQKGGTL